MMRRLKLTVLILTMLVSSSTFAQLTFKTTSPSVIAYYESLPADYNTNSNKYPVVIFLHGIGEKGPNTTDLATLQANIYKVAKLGPPMYVKNGTKFPFILIAPQLKNNYALWTSAYVMEVIKYVKTYLRIDEKRIYLTGLSMGGGGTWTTVQDNAKLFAAVAPVCGGYNTPSKAINIANEDVPVWAFHGDKDTVVPMSKTVNMVNAINAYHPSPLAKLTIYAGVAHDAWKYAYKPDHTVHNPNVYEWLLTHTNTVNGGNKIPAANAGADQSKTYGTSSIVLYGSGTDTDGSVSSYTWAKISGPSVTMTGATTKNLTLSKLAKGVYVFHLKVTDNSGNTDSDYVKVTIN
jgi:predicted peptidase